jgi:uncharacterized membrane protein
MPDAEGADLFTLFDETAPEAGWVPVQETNMLVEIWAMVCAGVAVLAAGVILARGRFRAASGAGKVLVLAPVFEAAPLAVFSAEHFTVARALMPAVPHWLPYPLFWVYFVGVALVSAAISFVAWRHVRWSAPLLALLFLIIVTTVDLPNLSRGMHDRLLWILAARELSFGAGAMVLAGSVWPAGNRAAGALRSTGRIIVAIVMVFYGVEHFLFPRFVTGVPLVKPMPAWMPAPAVITYVVGIALVLAGLTLFFPSKIRIAAAACGSLLLLLTVFLYGSILVADLQKGGDASLMVEDLNYVADTMLFAATVLLAGLGTVQAMVRHAIEEPV